MDAPRSMRVGFTGHQGLTPETGASVRTEIARELETLGTVEGVCSLAEGSDQIFAECVLAHGGRLVAVIPSRGYESTFTTSDSLATFTQLLAKAAEVITLEHETPSEAAYWAAGQRVVDESDRLIAVWDGQAAGGLGGTADVVGYAERLGKDVLVIWPQGARRR